MASPAPHTDEQHDKPFETRDVKIGPVIGFSVGILILIAISIGSVIGLMGVFQAQLEDTQQSLSPVIVDTEQLPPEGQPRLQANPERDLRVLQDADEAILNSYGWIDRDEGKVRIPIEDAKALLLERGVPVRDDQ